MNFIPVSTENYEQAKVMVILLFVFSFVSLVVGLIIYFRSTREGKDKRATFGNILGVVGFILILVSVVADVVIEVQDLAVRRDRIVAEVKNSYGLSISDDERASLRYPSEKPTADFEAFGSFERMLPAGDGGYELNRIFLIWEDGELKLAKSTDGESFIALKAEI